MIKNHRLQGAEFRKSPNFSNKVIVPRLIVLHDTAGSSYASSVNWLASKKSRASAHLVVSKFGHVTQLVPFNKKAWHAGKSEWNGAVGVNNFSIGIEMDNPGKLSIISGGRGRSWFGETFSAQKSTYAMTPEHGEGMWVDYPKEQRIRVMSLITQLVNKYPTIEDVVGHFQVSPGRKVDPNPLFPLYYAAGIAQSRK